MSSIITFTYCRKWNHPIYTVLLVVYYTEKVRVKGNHTEIWFPLLVWNGRLEDVWEDGGVCLL
jgi:hypothetical protein